ncbi:succinate dehydrogenase assembly factor 2 [Aquamicrobium ahrensii]|uniref:FAD assembly factor SdhE n=1 Tax=Aquamicrobium ahrensii TaxID=469551 RepID=A0ABV2KL07_9HYPH
MTGTTRTSEGLDVRRRKLLFRSWHRGMREMDLILGSFADAEIEGLSADELDQYERLLEINDTEMLPWITGQNPVPAGLDLPILHRVLEWRSKVASLAV